MAIEWHEIWDGRQGKEDLDMQVREWIRVWRGQTGDRLWGPKIVRDDLQQFIGTYYTTDASSDGEEDQETWPRTVEVRQDQDDPYFWVGVATYSNADLDVDPLARAPEIQIDFESYQRPFVRDISTGQAVVNTAGDPFDPPFMVDEDRMVIRITRNESETDFPWNAQDEFIPSVFNNTVNLTEFQGWNPGKVRLRLSAQKLKERGNFYWRVTYLIQEKIEALEVNDEVTYVGWQPNILNRGYRQLVGGVKKDIFGIDGSKVSQPALLALDGTKLADGGTPTYVEANAYLTSEFNDLGLPEL